MKKSGIIAGTIIILLISVAEINAATYWDLFKEPRSSGRDSAVPELIMSATYIQPMGSMRDAVPRVAGATTGIFIQKKQMRYGIEFSGLYGQSEEKEYAGSFDRVTDYFIMAPLFIVIGYSIDAGALFSIVPYMGLGASADFLSYAEDGLSVLGDTGKTDKWGVHPVQKPGIDLFINLFGDFRVRIGAAYSSLFEFGGSVEVAHMLMFGAGVSWRF